ncbi:MAG: Gfo/Idh/MocA family oxidoreductase [Verrucomicrobia bacterium]|nr:Gfo/Idh/MocA family oxidoreductase [Verrucomicrobiota bacterium]MBV8276865.1 Gfo/Idh/MocA family oxidoreductase [Verrucomicrobiota bacterium]
MTQKIKMGMVGGGRDAFIGGVHRMAARLDGRIELVAGAFSSDPAKSRASGEDLGLDPSRVYPDYETMAAAESKLPESERIDFASIVTPNNVHFPPAKTFLEAGFHVVCDKPMTFDLVEAKALREIVKSSGKVFALTHNYTGYPMVKEARELVRNGDLGKILKVVAEYPQGWLIQPIDAEGQKQAAWRTDPSRTGASSCIGDIGTHAENLGRYITGLEIEELCADFTTFVPGRRLEDDGNLLIRYHGGARGVLYASQVSVGEENNLSIRVYGTKASLEWHQEHPNELIVKYPDAPRKIYRRGNSYVSEIAKRFTRLPFGHPEAFIEAFANIYLEAARAIESVKAGKSIPPDVDYPTVEDGVLGMAFIVTAVASAQNGSSWTKLVA